MTEVRYDLTVAAPPIKALIIQPDATYEIRQIDQTVKSMQNMVGGYEEAVNVEGATLWVNRDNKNSVLEYNPYATYLWWKLDPEKEGLDTLAGPVIVTGPADEAGDSHPVLDTVVDLWRRMEAVRLTNSLEDPESGAERAP